MDAVRFVRTGVVSLVVLCSFWMAFFTVTDAAYLNDYILDYEPLQFDHAHLHEKHRRVRREIDPALRWNFKAYGRTFKLHLEPDNSIFAPDHSLEVNGRGTAQPAAMNFFYQGHLTDSPGSIAHMSVHEGHIWGQVSVPGHTTYYIEPAQHHLKRNASHNFHTIIYPESRMNLDPYRHKRNNSGMCPSDVYAKLRLKAQPVDNVGRTRSRREAENPYLKYSASLNAGGRYDEAKPRYRRQATGTGPIVNGKKTCFMQLRADAMLYNHFLEKYGNDAQRTEEVILSLFASHIKELTRIYEATEFQDSSNSNSRFNGMNFLLQRSTIIRSCGGTQGYSQQYCENTLDVSNYLDLTSEENHDVFCLVHTFTYRDFTDGTLGLAWVAEPGSRSAGVCGKFGKIRDSKKGIVERSLNTGIVTLINYNQDVPSKISQITLAHEVGHNFGAQHDVTPECAPYDTSRSDAGDGNYIMFPSAIPGTMAHNREFSPCSKSDIARVLATVGVEPVNRVNCFQASDQAFCGNNIVEDNEECDCGYEADCTDLCCYGRRENQETDCKLKPNVVCSPSEGQCCTESCAYRGVNFECAAETDCTETSSCLAMNASCPEAVHKPSFTTFCNNYGAVCDQGECVASVCRQIGWQECFRTSQDGVSDEQMCFISCRKTSTSECIGSNDADKVRDNPEFQQLLNTIRDGRNASTTAIMLPPGASCDNYKGYCDVFSKCRKVDAEGPFKQLTDLIFDPVTFKNIRNWAEDHWWAVLLICVGVIVFLGVFIYLFSYNTPSQDPKKKRQGQQGPDGRRPGPAGRRGDKRPAASAPYSVPIPMEERGRGSRPRSGAGSGAGAYPAGPYPAHDHRHSGRDNFGYDYRHDGRDNFGYDDGQGYQPPPPYHPPQGKQFDRIQGQRY